MSLTYRFRLRSLRKTKHILTYREPCNNNLWVTTTLLYKQSLSIKVFQVFAHLRYLLTINKQNKWALRLLDGRHWRRSDVFNLFVPNAPFLFPLKALENHEVSWCFQGVEKGCIENKWVNVNVIQIPHIVLMFLLLTLNK